MRSKRKKERENIKIIKDNSFILQLKQTYTRFKRKHVYGQKSLKVWELFESRAEEQH